MAHKAPGPSARVLASCPKAARSFDRASNVEATLARIKPLLERYGITRIAETTYLDRIGLPVVSAIVPNSTDALGVYNGKGLTRNDATAGAIMEAIERQVCARFEDVPVVEDSIAAVNAGLDLLELGWIGPDPATTQERVECAQGENLLGGSPLHVPLGIVRGPRLDEPFFQYTSSNGLASGNNVVEATYHALMELIERHLWSRLHLLACTWPQLLRMRAGREPFAPDDPIAYEVRDIGDALLTTLIERIAEAGLNFRLIAHLEPGWPVAMMACISEQPGEQTLFYHLGMGCSWSPVHAAIRAITEAAQVRLTDIQGAREDITRPGEIDPYNLHGRRPSGFPAGGRWYYDGPARRIALGDIPDVSSSDVAIDLKRALDILRDWGETCVAFVDLTPRDVPFSVVRVIVPHLERLIVDATTSRRMRAFLGGTLDALSSSS